MFVHVYIYIRVVILYEHIHVYMCTYDYTDTDTDTDMLRTARAQHAPTRAVKLSSMRVKSQPKHQRASLVQNSRSRLPVKPNMAHPEQAQARTCLLLASLV